MSHLHCDAKYTNNIMFVLKKICYEVFFQEARGKSQNSEDMFAMQTVTDDQTRLIWYSTPLSAIIFTYGLQ